MSATQDLAEIRSSIRTLQEALHNLAGEVETRLGDLDRRLITLEATASASALGDRMSTQIAEVRADIANLGHQLNTSAGLLLERLITSPPSAPAPAVASPVATLVPAGPPQPPPGARSRITLNGRELPRAVKGA